MQLHHNIFRVSDINISLFSYKNSSHIQKLKKKCLLYLIYVKYTNNYIVENPIWILLVLKFKFQF